MGRPVRKDQAGRETVLGGSVARRTGPATCAWREKRAGEQEYRNGFYERSLVAIFGTLVLRIARTRRQSFLPRALGGFNGGQKR